MNSGCAVSLLVHFLLNNKSFLKEMWQMKKFISIKDDLKISPNPFE